MLRRRTKRKLIGMITIAGQVLSTAPILAASSESLWVANTNSHAIVQFQPPLHLDSYPTGLAFDEKGNAWATVGFSVEELPSTALKTLQKSTAPAPKAKISSSSFDEPFGCAFDPLGNLWIADASGALFELSKKQLSPGTRSVTPAQKITSGSFLCLHFPAFDTSGDLWVSDECRNEIFEFTPRQLKSGGALSPNIIIGGSMSGPEQIAFDRDGDLWVANFLLSNVVEFGSGTIVSTGSPPPAVTLSSNGGSPASLDEPLGLAFDAAGDLWVSNLDNSTFVEFSAASIASSGDPDPTILIQGINNQSGQMTFGPVY
jgi:streptogramin lyase